MMWLDDKHSKLQEYALHRCYNKINVVLWNDLHSNNPFREDVEAGCGGTEDEECSWRARD